MAARAKGTLVVRDMDEGTEVECSVDDFLDDNESSAALTIEVHALKVGDVLDVGGGAAPHIKITRKS